MHTCILLSLSHNPTHLLPTQSQLPHSAEHYESLLKAPLVSWRDGSSYANLPQLKKHLEESWVVDVRKRRSTATANNKKRDDEAKEKKRRSASP